LRRRAFFEQEHIHLVLRHRVEPDLARPAEEVGAPVDLGRPPRHQPPADLPHVVRHRDFGEQHRPRRRKDAVRPHHEVISPRAAVIERHFVRQPRRNRRHRPPERNVWPREPQPFRENPVQRRPQYAPRPRNPVAARNLRADLRQKLARRIAGQQPVRREPLPHHRIEDAEPLHHPQRRPGDGDPRAIDLPVRVDVDEVDLDTGFPEPDGRRHAGYAAADDQRAPHFVHDDPAQTWKWPMPMPVYQSCTAR
jgi:hypothetical protein